MLRPPPAQPRIMSSRASRPRTASRRATIPPSSLRPSLAPLMTATMMLSSRS